MQKDNINIKESNLIETMLESLNCHKTWPKLTQEMYKIRIKADKYFYNQRYESYNMSYTEKCPFCGNTKSFSTIIDVGDEHGIPTYYSCSICGARGPRTYALTENKVRDPNKLEQLAKDAWNARTK